MKEGTKTKLNHLGKLIFYNGTPVAFDYLVNKSLSGNTYRGFHKVNKSGIGSADVFRNFLWKNDSIFFEKLKEINNQEEYHIFLNALADDLRQKLSNILPKQLNSYNKLRKPLDIYFEHLISMDSRYTKYRTKLISLLNLPLDSWMFKDEFVFSAFDLKFLRIKRSFSFTNIKTEEHYIEIQSFLREKVKKEGVQELIYLDLLWGNRIKRKGDNLFELNPPKTTAKKKTKKVRDKLNNLNVKDSEEMHQFLCDYQKSNIEFEVILRNDGRYILTHKDKYNSNKTPRNAVTWVQYNDHFSIRIYPNPLPFDKLYSLTELKKKAPAINDAIRLIS